MDELRTILLAMLKDTHSAERQALRLMQRLARKLSSGTLAGAVRLHITQTETQIARLEEALSVMGTKPGRRVCLGMKALVEEALEAVASRGPGPEFDLLALLGLQRIEHFEIATYGAIADIAGVLHQDAVAELARETLAEERQTAARLSDVLRANILVAAAAGIEGNYDEAENDAPAALQTARGGPAVRRPPRRR
jgi:ferritin-like metal-binding protein YciE